MRTAIRRTPWLTFCLVGMVLFAQLAVAAHACPAWLEQAGALIASTAMPDCEHGTAGAPEGGHPPLCKAHCQPDAQSVTPLEAADMASQPVLLTVLDWDPVSQRCPRLAGHAPLVRSGAPPPGSPPLYLSLLVLRN